MCSSDCRPMYSAYQRRVHGTTVTTAHWHELNGWTSRLRGYKGCMGHYSPKGHKVLANDIIPQIAQIMSWNATELVFM
eukprot:NODE_9278_length_347_cov_200.184932.p2 GENE.NODE_9278_length_347_cov_200.184932~~NODE_9278_length_347_cov_200.184932.p2  ORF type:complete len:78 (-),score=13.96 NODE_9278_length_347_cov_200.184932:114-347(-)